MPQGPPGPPRAPPGLKISLKSSFDLIFSPKLLGWLACCAQPWLGLAWACLACLASNNNSGGAAAAGRRRRPVVVAGPGQGKAGKAGPGQTKPRLGTTGKPAKPKQFQARFQARFQAILAHMGPKGPMGPRKTSSRLGFQARPSLTAWKLACCQVNRLGTVPISGFCWSTPEKMGSQARNP